MSSVISSTSLASAKERLLSLAEQHDCWDHPLFARLESCRLTRETIAALLRNYDAHASVLRRLLLRAATAMPEPAVGYVLENVRNEYGNGDYSQNHQQQLQDLAWRAGVQREQYLNAPISEGVRRFCKRASFFYSYSSNAYASNYPQGAGGHSQMPVASRKLRPAVISGAITATEIMAIREFRYLQKAFASIGLEHHIWFNHVTIEEEHSDESLALALYFIDKHRAFESVALGMIGILEANMDLYDGLLEALN